MRRVRVIQDISSCSQCPHFKASDPRPTEGGKQEEDWFCTNPNVPDSRGGKRAGDYTQRRIQGSVSFPDKPLIPEWCPFEVVPDSERSNA